MRSFPAGGFTRLATATVLASSLAGFAATGHAAVGAKVILQGWEPWNDNHQTALVPIDDPAFISGPLNALWANARTQLCAAFHTIAGKQDLIRPGITLYNLSCQLNAADIRMERVGPNRARLVVELNGSRLTATSTTPSLEQLGVDAPLVGGIGLPGATDPRFSIGVDAQLVLDVEIGDAPNPFLTVHRASFDLRNADARGVNITGKLGEWIVSKVVPFFGGPNFERMIESELDSFGKDYAKTAQRALDPVNAAVGKYTQYVRVQTWITPNRIAIALQPRNLPRPPLNGEMRGVLRDQRTVAGQPGARLDCAGFRVTAQYQTEPRLLKNPDRLDDLEPAKMAPVGTFLMMGALADGSCSYAVRGLAAGFTNYVNASHPLAGRGASGSLINVRTVLLHPGWNGSSVDPRPLQTGRDYVMAMDLQGQATVIQRDPRRQIIDPHITDPRLRFRAPIAAANALPVTRLNPAVNVLSPATRMQAQAAKPASVTAIGSAVALNPQPLPPKTQVLAPIVSTRTNVTAGPSKSVAAIGSAVALNPQPLPPKVTTIAPVQAVTPVLTVNRASSLAITSGVSSAAAARAALVR